MGKRAWIFVSVTIVALVATTAALAYSHSGPFYTASYNPQVWNYGTGIGNVSPTQSADALTIPASLVSGFEESALRDLGSCLECEMWTGAPASMAWIGTDSYGSLKIAAGISNRFFTISGNLGTTQTSTHVTREILCGYANVDFAYTNTACSSGTTLQASYNTNGSMFYGLPAGTTTQNYASLAFTLATCTSAGSVTWSNDAILVNQASSELPGSGNVASAVTCANEVWTAYVAMGGVTSGTFTYGGLTYHVFHLPQADCTNYEFNIFNSTNVHGSYPGNKCYEAYALHTDLASTLEHTFPVAFGSQTALATDTLSPALTSTPNTTNLTRVRNFVDGLPGAYTDEWNCLLDPTYVVCPTAVIPPTPPTAGCFNAPEPNTNESFADYKLRIQNNGYTGTIVEVNDPNYPVGGTGYPNGSDAAVLIVGTSTGVGSLGTGGSVTMAYVSSTGKRVPATSWRGASICPGTTTEVDIYDVPSAGTGGTTGGVNSLPALDFSPITSVSYGTAFPFGIFPWIQDVFSRANCESLHGGCNHPPSFTLTKPDGGSIFVDLTSPTWVSTWREPVFYTLEFLITLAAVWFLAVRVLGIGGSDSDGS